MSVHTKIQTSYGGYIRNVVYDSNHFETTEVSIHLDSGHQSGGVGASSPGPLYTAILHCH